MPKQPKQPKQHGKPWRAEEEDVLTECYSSVGPHRLTDVICRTWRGIEKKAGTMLLTAETPRWKKSECEKAMIGPNIKGRSENAVRTKRHYLYKKHSSKPKCIKSRIIGIPGHENMTCGEIAAAIGAKKSSVIAIVQQHKIEVKKRQRKNTAKTTGINNND